MLLAGYIPLTISFQVHPINLPDIMMLLFMLITIISFALSSYKDVSFLGSEGWFVGFMTMIICCVLYFLVSRLWKFRVIMLYIALAVAAIVYILGILDRFSLYIIPLEIRDPSFISTIGNINWFMGYYCIFTPIGVGLFLTDINFESNISIKEILLGAFVIISFAAGIAQGSESVFLFFGALFLGLAVLGQLKVIKTRDILLLIALGSLGGYIDHVLRVLHSEGYNYELDGLCARITLTPVLLLVFIISLTLWYVLVRIRRDIPSYLIYILYGILFIAWLAIGILKARYGYFENLTNSMFLFNEHFGSGRGAAYKIGFEAFKNMSLREKIFGVGPDAFSAFIYGHETTNAMVMSVWPHDYLTNSHCELLTSMVNEGVLGVFAYIGIFGAFIGMSIRAVRMNECADISEIEVGIKNREAVTICALIALLAFCYMIHNFISFSQVLSTPFLFIMMGAGRAVFFDIEGL